VSKLLIGGRWVDGISTDRLCDKYKGATFGEMAVASLEQVDEAVAGASAAVAASTLGPYDRYRILSKAARLLEDRFEKLIALMRDEVGFTRADGLPNSDLPRTLGDSGEQHVHDPDAADGENESRQKSEQQLGEQHRLAGVLEALGSDFDVEFFDTGSVALGEPVDRGGAQRIDRLDAPRLQSESRQARLARRLEE